jgi:ketosteroid isomerase-like protein
MKVVIASLILVPLASIASAQPAMMPAAPAAPAAQAPASSSEQELIDIETAWSKAIVAQDAAALSKILSPDWHVQNENVGWSDRAAAFKRLPDEKVTSMTNRDVHVRITGDTAIVQGMDDEVDVVKGKPTKMVYSWTDIFQKQDGHWMAVASQDTPMAPPEK